MFGREIIIYTDIYGAYRYMVLANPVQESCNMNHI